MPKSRLLKRLMLSWVHEPSIEGGQEMAYGRSLERHLKYFGLVDDSGKAISFSEWAALAQDRGLAEARHESVFRHWKTAATAAPVRHQGHARGETEVFG